MMKVWNALYCSCIFESAAGTLSVHRTKRGARKTIIKHKLNARKEYQLYWEYLKKENGDDAIYEFGIHEDWWINEVELLD